jgi:hypothetical protein
MFSKKRSKKADPKRDTMEPSELLTTVGSLAKQGMTQRQIAAELGFKTPFTLNNRLVKASQATGKPVPAFRPRRKTKLEKRVDAVKVKKRGKGEACGVNIPQEPLIRAGAKVGSRFSVKASRGRVVLTAK